MDIERAEHYPKATETIDGMVACEIRSEIGYKGILHQHDDYFASSKSRRTPYGELLGSTGEPLYK